MSKQKIVWTELDGDDWHWFFIGQELIYSGHSNIDKYILEPLLKKVCPDAEIKYQYEWLEEDIAEQAGQVLGNLSDISNIPGYWPEDILLDVE